ncbi:hypothetical protein QBZ16_005115 [Prototheca wickerhamii]|uniref:Exportin-T n=1 Tax=Prototheca wickerhamii TaxID=3111 RepID=A0AAD9IIT1_PROWI|nr:hypothetical protein QBZ16_005115 [Prototheca wickerhamii]
MIAPSEMADDFERAVYYSFAQPGVGSAELAAQATAALEAAKSGPDAWRLCLSHLCSSGYVEVRFWCLQTLHELVQHRYAELATPEARDELKRALLGAALGAQAPAARPRRRRPSSGTSWRRCWSRWRRRSSPRSGRAFSRT